MDDDYAASIKTVGGVAKCPSGTIRRKAYSAVRNKKTIRVRSTCVKDRGAPGRWQTIKGILGIGKLKTGDLKTLGYDPMEPVELRHWAVERAVRRYGPKSTLQKLNAIATYTKRTNPSRSKTYRTDKNYVQKKYFGA